MTVWDPDSNSLPKLEELPAIEGAPHYAAWFWGKDDEASSTSQPTCIQTANSNVQLGRLNLLTPKRIAKAASLIQTGESAGLNFPAGLPYPTFFGREPFKHTLKQVNPRAYDDLYSLNTQSSSQWDGFRHVGHDLGGGYIWYNHTTREQITNSSKNGIHAWSKKGIVGRGVLLDFYSFSGQSYHPFDHRHISAQELKACAKAQNVTFEYGDVLIVRTGWSDAYKMLDQKGREELGAKGYLEITFAGLDRSRETIEMLHDNYFSAVASDAPAFESWPMDDPEHLHHFLLPLWGVPIGEMWDLDRLAELCKKHNRYTFFLTSSPANVEGGVGSSPNAIAIF
ncbi:uncharacterized protein Z520_12334 [Fonsecaea multimorphosa CBS 102226]|uniref:Cyclase n=1 Tax=Fonsecaea multimorphosa CBS 102226 TaxID=1442371 RepID=A0A0D2GR23_9EURO|nr:uncharacterized protein Z520_12334 [Fonsecaea multimorphosa CBS 102226]KIX91945.1 hypothetical protein Z520_12334 [Fonsecaea multimorphosa CBS 102226]OAL17316.1 hypothetical protein AYO22_11758 [Fonsecaea multimorphosa]